MAAFKGVGRKIFRGLGQRKKDCKMARPKNSTIKPLSTISVPCMKIQWGHGPLPSPMAALGGNFDTYICLNFQIRKDSLDVSFLKFLVIDS